MTERLNTQNIHRFPDNQAGARPTRPTSNETAEITLIGCALQSPAALDILASADLDLFTDELCAEAARLLADLHRAGKAATTVSLRLTGRDELNENDLDALEAIKHQAASYDHQEMATAAKEAMINAKAFRVIEQAAHLCRNAACAPEGTSGVDVLTQLFSDLQKLAETGNFAGQRSAAEVGLANSKLVLSHAPAFSTGIDALDRLTQGGLRPSRMTVLAGLYGTGKTLHGGSISYNLAAQKISHLYLSLELREDEIELRNNARDVGMTAEDLLDPKSTFDREKVSQIIAQKSAERGPYVRYKHAPGATMDTIIQNICEAYRNGAKGFILDWFGLIGGRVMKKEDEFLRECADQLAGVCRRYNMFGLVITQYEGGSSTNYGREPISRGLLASGANCVLFDRVGADKKNPEYLVYSNIKANHGPRASSHDPGIPGAIFDLRGPHIRNLTPAEITEYASAGYSGGDGPDI